MVDVFQGMEDAEEVGKKTMQHEGAVLCFVTGYISSP